MIHRAIGVQEVNAAPCKEQGGGKDVGIVGDPRRSRQETGGISAQVTWRAGIFLSEKEGCAGSGRLSVDVEEVERDVIPRPSGGKGELLTNDKAIVKVIMQCV